MDPRSDTRDEVVRRHGAIQAQDYEYAKWSIGQRPHTLVDEDVDAALASGAIIRTHVLRPTWHFAAGNAPSEKTRSTLRL